MRLSLSAIRPLLIFACLVVSMTGISSPSWGYATFIGYGYSNCTTCHYNPHGGGQLNDYGRALFASEIAAKPFWNPKAKDEDLANKSSFTFSEPSPRAFHPSVKYRELLLTTSPGGLNSNKQYVMQADAGFAYHFDPNDKYILVASVGYTRLPLNSETEPGAWNYNLLSREHYVRAQITDQQFVSVGLMDIVYGLRIVDHTAVNRSGIGLNMNSQVHGVLYDYFGEKWMVGVHAFGGNQFADKASRLSGVSTTAEYLLQDRLTVGTSALAGSTEFGQKILFGVHTRVGAGKGSSLMAEMGVSKFDPKEGDATTGAYGILVGTLGIVRGLEFESQMEIAKNSIQDSSSENYRYSFGFIYFPFQRVELRLQAVDYRELSPTDVKRDAWFIQSQLHLSL